MKLPCGCEIDLLEVEYIHVKHELGIILLKLNSGTKIILDKDVGKSLDETRQRLLHEIQLEELKLEQWWRRRGTKSPKTTTT